MMPRMIPRYYLNLLTARLDVEFLTGDRASVEPTLALYQTC